MTTVAGPDITRFDEIKVGDKVTARYYENLVIRLKKPGEKDVDTSGRDDGLRAGAAGWNEGPATDDHRHDYRHRPSRPSITFTGPNGWTYMRRVEDKRPAKVKVGDKVDIVWTEALLLALER